MQTPELASAIPGTIEEQALILPPGLSFEQWDEIGVTLLAVEAGIQWWIGDWLNYGEDHLPDRYTQAEAFTARSYSTLTKWSYVARRFPAFRRRKMLSWSHHAELASLPPCQADRVAKEIEPEAPDQPAKRSVAELRSDLGRGPRPEMCPDCGRRILVSED